VSRVSKALRNMGNRMDQRISMLEQELDTMIQTLEYVLHHEVDKALIERLILRAKTIQTGEIES
jgi:hypothetical protein